MSTPPNRCDFHPDRPSVFRCRSCAKSYCEECRSPEQRNACVRCDMFVGVREAAEPTVPLKGAGITRKRIPTKVVVGGLLVINLGLVIWWALLGAPVPAQVDAALDAVGTISQVVERSRDTSGLVPPNLDGVVGRLPADVAALVRNGDVRYRPSTDRRTFAVERTFDRSVPEGTADEDQP